MNKLIIQYLYNLFPLIILYGCHVRLKSDKLPHEYYKVFHFSRNQ